MPAAELTAGAARQAAKDFLGGMGLGMLAGQLADLKLGELLDTPPPGLDEAVAIAKARCLCFHMRLLKLSIVLQGCGCRHPESADAWC